MCVFVCVSVTNLPFLIFICCQWMSASLTCGPKAWKLPQNQISRAAGSSRCCCCCCCATNQWKYADKNTKLHIYTYTFDCFWQLATTKTKQTLWVFAMHSFTVVVVLLMCCALSWNSVYNWIMKFMRVSCHIATRLL